MRKIQIIMLEPRKRDELMKDVGRGKVAVYMALRYATNGPVPELIRKKAIEEYGGVKTTKMIY